MTLEDAVGYSVGTLIWDRVYHYVYHDSRVPLSYLIFDAIYVAIDNSVRFYTSDIVFHSVHIAISQKIDELP
jgi:hypothetical protein